MAHLLDSIPFAPQKLPIEELFERFGLERPQAPLLSSVDHAPTVTSLLTYAVLLAAILAVKGCGAVGTGDDPGPGYAAGGADRIKSPVSYKGSFPRGKGMLSSKLTVAGVARDVKLYLPAKRVKAPALLVTFHGTNGEADYMITSSGAKDLAESKGLVVASPQALFTRRGDWDNHEGSETYWITHPTTSPEKNPDLLLLRAIIQEAERAYGIDTRRVYLLGHSNGGFFALLGAVALPDLVAAFAANSSGLVRCEKTGTCTFKGSGRSCSALAVKAGACQCTGTEKPVAIPDAGSSPKLAGFITHSSDDPTVSVHYSCELAAKLKAKGHDAQVVLREGSGHDLPTNLAQQAWRFMKSRAR